MIHDRHEDALRQVNHAVDAQPGERAAHGLDGEPAKIDDVIARHQQHELVGVLAIALVAPRQCDEETCDTLGRLRGLASMVPDAGLARQAPQNDASTEIGNR